MKNKAKRLLALLLVAVMVQWYYPMGSEAEVYAADTHAVSVTEDGDSIIIGNDYISREFSIADDKLQTVNITNKRTDGDDTVFTPAEGSEEFIIRETKKEFTVDSLAKTGWTATADSYQNSQLGANDGPPANLIDGNTTTFWHSAYNSSGAVVTNPIQKMPYNVVITLNGAKEFQTFAYTARSDAQNGRINSFNLYIYNGNSTEALAFNSAEWGEPVLTDSYENSGGVHYSTLENKVTATQIRIEVTSSYGDTPNAFASGAEIDLIEDPINDQGRSFAASQLTLDGDVVIEDTTATINDVEKTGKKITFNFAPYTFNGVEYTISENIVMYDGDHFMRKYMEISVPADKKEAAVIDYIDLESFGVNDTDATWTIPRTAGGIVQMDQFKANLGQPIYIQGMFFGCEFPAANTEILDGTGFMRYYTGKSFDRFVRDNQAAEHDGVVTYNTWQTVAGAARSTEQEVIQADFFEYIKSIATPSEFRVQYNSWFDNMMRIDDENILESFIEIDRELNAVETRPLDSYVIDDGWTAYNNGTIGAGSHIQSGAKINETGFWEFNEKFPNELTPSSELVQNFGSNFGVWIGPRGGYNFYGTLADILTASGKGSKAGGSIDVADRTYVENFTNMVVDWQNRFGVNYWKWDGFVDQGQYGAFAAADGVPGYANRHMTGGYQHMYHVTDLWEAWTDLMEACRANAKERGVDDLWISLTCYVHPSPWFLQWANSVWIQCVHDQQDASFGSTKMNKQITYRDSCYYDFIVNHEFQFPLSNVYNHDPIYGKEGTGMTINTATDEDFKNYLYMLSTRGTAFWELYFSDSIMTPGKYEVTSEFLAWAEESYHMLKNAKMIGGSPDSIKLSNPTSNQAYANAYGFSCFDGTDGILSLRNPAMSEKTITFTFDRTMGVAEDAGTLKYHLEHTYNLTDGTAQTGTLEYGKTYTITLQPNEVRILRVSADGDTTAPEYTRAYTDGDRTITVKFNEKVDGSLFTVDGVGVSSIEKSADDITYRITLAQTLTETTDLTVTAKDIKDLAGNALAEKDIVVTYVPGNKVAEETVSAAGEIAAEADSIASNNGFTVTAKVETAVAGAVVSQGEAYELGIDANGKAYFTLNGATATSKTVVADGATIVGVKENNGILKLYVNGELESSAYKADNRYYEVPAAAITAGGADFGAVTASVYDIALGYDKVAALEVSGTARTPIPEAGMTATVSGVATEDGGAAANVIDNNTNTFWTSQTVDNVADGEAWVAVDLGNTYVIDRVDYTKRYDSNAIYNCTGNITNYVLEVSADNGATWEEVATGATATEGGTTQITFDAVEATNIRVKATSSYHWQSPNTSICVAELDIYGEGKVAQNLALNKNAIAAWTVDGSDAAKGGDRPMSMAVDGSKDNTGNYGEFGADNDTRTSYMQVDLGKVSEIESINLYRYWQDGRTYKNTVIAIAEKEADFANGNAYIVYNTDTGNINGLGEGTDTPYGESASGKTFTLDSTVEGRYVRVYMNGTASGGTTNHVVELEVMGYQSGDAVVESGVDISALINRLAELAQVDTTGSTAASVAQFEALVQTGYDLVAAGAQTQDEVDAMIESLVDAESILVAKPVIDKSELQSAIEEAEELTADDYTEESWASFAAALAAAKDVNADANATQEAVNTALANLTAAQDALEDKPVVTPVDKTALAAAIAEAEELTADDYTEESWEEFQIALATAKAVNANADATEADVAKAVADLAAAQDALEEKPAEPVNPFEDVYDADYYYDSVMWAVENGVTDGWTATTFAPNMGCTRGQVVTFLWRAAGEPKAENAENPFTDVAENAYYYDAVLWAVEEGITDGWTATTFAPDMTCTRGQIVTFIWRAAGEVEVTAENPFTDVAENAYYYDAVLWAVENGITDGWTATTFAPDMECTRGQVVTFLYRHYN